MKMNHLEIEYKTLLSKKEYQELLSFFSDTSAIEQTNHYIDTPNFAMKANHSSLRIRTFYDRAELTLKQSQKIGNMEYNQALTLLEAQGMIKNFYLPEGAIKDLLVEKEIPLSQLSIWGSLTTKRLEKRSAIGLMALDKNDYLGQTDYELEVEVTDPQVGKKAFEYFLKEHNIQFKYASSKVARTAIQKMEEAVSSFDFPTTLF